MSDEDNKERPAYLWDEEMKEIAREVGEIIRKIEEEDGKPYGK